MDESHRHGFDLYTACMNCMNARDKCPGVWKDIPRGVPPRGFYFESVPVQLLVVGKNPGHPLRGERELYAGLSGVALFRAHRRFQETYYRNPDIIAEPSNRFRKNLSRYLGIFLGVPEDQVYQHAAHTNLVKCSTPNEQAKLNSTTMDECFQKHFLAELDLLRPKVLLALGRQVERFLRWKQNVHRRPVVYVRHPSYRYRREIEAIVLAGIREQIQSHL